MVEVILPMRSVQHWPADILPSSPRALRRYVVLHRMPLDRPSPVSMAYQSGGPQLSW
ncbi:hypothetical protein S40285_10684 [Stachybotrys chlorohalonatus IBT 40285]|uniref:Uncharacterized protein n=1 Tax=Stachybotrys chlorohalonatus (strain IBT 40285) TaxID=1283841 RepID=A0A084Q7U7_STAC4|nr:hypothetical protein S40285_10684 [Stachybotrys chlorohalonata IBT 40285]